jgi:hypothetical protein
VKRFILDGEIVALDERGRHSFALLQKVKTSKAPLLFYVFDLLHIDNDNLTKRILEKRRRRLEREFAVLPKNIQLSPILSSEVSDIIAHVKQFEFEGVIAKRVGNPAPVIAGPVAVNWSSCIFPVLPPILLTLRLRYYFCRIYSKPNTCSIERASPETKRLTAL